MVSGGGGQQIKVWNMMEDFHKQSQNEHQELTNSFFCCSWWYFSMCSGDDQ
jgi:hypothetical protein